MQTNYILLTYFPLEKIGAGLSPSNLMEDSKFRALVVIAQLIAIKRSITYVSLSIYQQLSLVKSNPSLLENNEILCFIDHA